MSLIFGFQILRNSIKASRLRAKNAPTVGASPTYEADGEFRWAKVPKYAVVTRTTDIAVGNDWTTVLTITVTTAGPIELRVMVNASDSGSMRIQRDGADYIASLPVGAGTNRETFGDNPSSESHTYTVQCDNITTVRTGTFIAIWEP